MFLLISASGNSFRERQMEFPRVKQAYEEKNRELIKLLSNHNIISDEIELYIRAFKSEKKIELWAKNRSDDTFTLVREYKVLNSTGGPGPKRKQGDKQTPEGFYYIKRFNPKSKYYLSLGINYPNASDLAFADKDNPGGDIFIHGGKETVGCLPIGDDSIRELYLLCVEARNAGQDRIPVHIFPAKPASEYMAKLQADYKHKDDYLHLWEELKIAFVLFEQARRIPKIIFKEDGSHEVK
ncbi:MAG: murein L,D-transpeptidase family protein [Candidatus Kapaibacterium sp.]